MPFGPEDQRTALEALERLGHDFTPFEEKFVEDMRVKMDADRPLSDRELKLLEQIYLARAV